MNENIKKRVGQVYWNELTYDGQVQRPLEVSRVNGILRSGFNPLFLGTITVSRRESGAHVVLDGWTRVNAAQRAEYEGPFDATVYEGLDLTTEAALFRVLNNTKAVSALDKLRVRVVERDPIAVAINEILADNGWRLSAAVTEEYNFAAATAIEAIYVKSPWAARSTIEIITRAWEGFGADNRIVAGLSGVLLRDKDRVDFGRMADALAGTRPPVLLGQARVAAEVLYAKKVIPSVSHVIVELYNKRARKNKLQSWR